MQYYLKDYKITENPNIILITKTNQRIQIDLRYLKYFKAMVKLEEQNVQVKNYVYTFEGGYINCSNQDVEKMIYELVNAQKASEAKNMSSTVYVKNVHIRFIEGLPVIEIETENQFIKVDNKFLDYFMAVRELAKQGVLVTFMEYDIQDFGIRCMNPETNALINRKYNELFPPSLSGKEIYLKCLGILKREGKL